MELVLHKPSIFKAGGIAAIITVIFNLLPMIPNISPVFQLVAEVGAYFVFFLAGLGYGYFAPGEENLLEGIVGGLLAGLAAGIIYCILYSFLNFATVESSVALQLLGMSIITYGSLGGIFGAAGGFIWPRVQSKIEG